MIYWGIYNLLWEKLASQDIPDPHWSGQASCHCCSGLAPQVPPASVPLRFEWTLTVDLLYLVSKAVEHERTSKFLWKGLTSGTGTEWIDLFECSCSSCPNFEAPSSRRPRRGGSLGRCGSFSPSCEADARLSEQDQGSIAERASRSCYKTGPRGRDWNL